MNRKSFQMLLSGDMTIDRVNSNPFNLGIQDKTKNETFY